MYIYIEIQELVVNALIELAKKNTRMISFKDLDDYGARVIEVLNGDEDVHAVLVVSRESQQAIVEDYSDFFEYANIGGAKGICLKDGVEAVDLWEKFCASLSLRVVEALKSKQAVQGLGA